MSVLVDTSVWSLVLRRSKGAENPWAHELHKLIQHSRVRMIGPIRQEVLSGVRERHQCDSLQTHLTAFPDVRITTEDYEKAAELFNACRSKGIQGSHIDFLICAVALRHDWEVFTTDKDFARYAKAIGVKLYQPTSVVR